MNAGRFEFNSYMTLKHHSYYGETIINIPALALRSGLVVLLFTACYAQAALSPALELQTGVWNEFSPGGGAVCADGSAYAYYVYPGTVNKVVIDFQGGGACWDDETCSSPQDPEIGADGFYVASVSGPPAAGASGIYDRDHELNPFADWHHVFIPYCTGDVHWGNSTVSYRGPGGEIEVRHKGAVNARAVLSWVFSEFEAPETVFVTGCSAGAYGSIMWTPLIKEHYLGADVYQLGDSGAGISTERYVASGLNRWNIEGALPSFVPGLDPKETDVLQVGYLNTVYSAIGRHYPDAVVSQYNTLFDGVQSFFYELMGGEPREWSGKMKASLEAVGDSADNFYAYTADYARDPESGATPHCIIPRPEFYTLETNGVPFIRWLSDMVAGRNVQTVMPAE